jgi:hypothetical protein
MSPLVWSLSALLSNSKSDFVPQLCPCSRVPLCICALVPVYCRPELLRVNALLFLVFEHMSQDLKVYLDSIGSEGMDLAVFKSFSEQLLRGLAEVRVVCSELCTVCECFCVCVQLCMPLTRL